MGEFQNALQLDFLLAVLKCKANKMLSASNFINSIAYNRYGPWGNGAFTVIHYWKASHAFSIII